MTHQTQHITICGGGYAGTMALGRLRMLLHHADAVLVQEFDVGISSEEPQQFDQDTFEMAFLRSQHQSFCVCR